MKTRNIFISLLLAAVSAAPLFARTFKAGDKIYVHADQTVQNTPEDNKGGFDWTVSNAKLFLYVFDGDVDKFIELAKKEGKTYMATMPSGTWKKCIVTRQDPGKYTPSWDAVWTQTSDLDIPDDAVLNGIRKMPEKYKAQDTYWTHFVPEAANIGQYVKATEEHFSICENAFGGPYALHTKLTSDKSAYDHTGIKWHAWFRSYDKQTWTALDKYAGTVHDGETLFDLPDNVLPKLSEVTSNPKKVYYFLYSTDATGQRLISLTPDAEGCDLDCSITYLGAAPSAVNVDNNTYTLDGMVAFGKADGNLVITYQEGLFVKDTTITNASSPQTFWLRGLPATGKQATVTAKFTNSGNSACSYQIEPTAPSASQKPDVIYVDVLVGQTQTLTPAGAEASAAYKWKVGAKDTTVNSQKLVTPVYNETNTSTYTYIEFSDPEENMNNLMNNGSYEDKTLYYGEIGERSTISDHKFWGIKDNLNTQLNYYESNPGANDGFAIVQSAYNFAPTYAKVTTRPGSGNYFALFDSKVPAEKNYKAWKAETKPSDAKAPKNDKLVLKNGTTYLFSFWAANINNYGEMDNAAKLQFQIEYNGKTQKLGEVLDLGSSEFRNNRWHQCSAIFKAEANADKVVISVVNLNESKLTDGNDFALDDIQFRAVSSPTRTVRLLQEYVVRTHEPKIYQMTAAAQPMACGETEYEVKIGVEYTNPKGKLVVEDLTTGKKVLNKEVSKPAWDSKTWHRFSIKLDTLTAKEHKFKAYFDTWTKAEAKASSTAPEYSKCCTEGLMFRKWENVIFINNHDSIFVGYQWFKNGQKLNGETKQRLYTGATSLKGTNDLYHCQLTHKDGTTELTCEQKFDDIPSSAKITAVEDIMVDGFAVYPTQVSAGAAITIVKTVPGTYRATLLSLTGQMAGTMLLTGDENTMLVPDAAGMYLLQLQGTNTQRTIKINVY